MKIARPNSGESLRRGAVIAIVVALTMGAATAFMAASKLFNPLQDDAFYYLQIARHVANGDGFTFDGVHRTNGFQPLWLFTLIPIVRALPGDILPVRAMILFQVLLISLAAIELDAVLRRRLGGRAAATTILVFLALPGTQLILACGMESALLLFLIIRVICSWLAVSEDRSALRGWFILGLWCALAFLARLEAGVLAPLLALLAHREWRRRPAVLVALLAMPLAIGLGYVTWNRLAFGLWIPISGVVKMSPEVDARIGVPASYLVHLFWSFRQLFGDPANAHLHRVVNVAFPTAVFGGIIFTAVAHRRLRQSLSESGLGVPLLICVGLWLAMNTPRRIAPWYPVAMLLVVALVVGSFLRSAPRLAMIASVGLAALGIGRGVVHGWRDLRMADATQAAIGDSARWARENIPIQDRIGAWNAGQFAWLSHRTVVNLDGLVNDRNFYARVIVGHDLKGYTEDECILWFAEVAETNKPERPMYGWTTDDTVSIPMRRVYTRIIRADILTVGIWRNEDPIVCRINR